MLGRFLRVHIDHLAQFDADIGDDAGHVGGADFRVGNLGDDGVLQPHDEAQQDDGQGHEAGMIFRGTQAGLTTQALIERHGPQAIQGRTSLSGQLAARGYRVSPPIDAPSLHESRYAGGYTVVSYGSHRPDGIDAIQLEFGRDLRNSPHLPQDLAASLIAFLRDFGFMEAYPAKP